MPNWQSCWALVGSGTAILLAWVFFLRKYQSPLRHIPAVKVDWRTALYGWVYKEPEPAEVLQWVKQLPQHHELVRYPGVGGAERVLILSPSALREVLIDKAYNDFQKPPLNRQRLAMFGNGLLVSDGEEHRAQKKKMLPAFAPRNIRALVPTMWAKACTLADLLRQEVLCSGDDLELTPWTSRAALDIIGVAAWGKDFHALENPRTETVMKYHRMFRGSPKANHSSLAKFFDNIARGSRAINEACRTAIAERRASTAESTDILKYAMSTGAFNDTELAGQMLNILAAGHETSSLAVTWACYTLAKHSVVQERLRDELHSSLPSIDGAEAEVTAELLESLTYLRAVVRECLRLIPTAPVTRREAKRDTSIAGFAIPKGTSIVGLHDHFNTRPEEWGPDAMEFRPERWLDPEGHAADNLFMTFNIGPRSCIGQGFAILEVSALLAAIVRRFDIRLIDPDLKPRLIYSITVKPVGLKFRMKPLE
ncbi:hypothetical protein CERZMDRAFT_99417 [Cercospora zeae-maydis SCOH1-5]|uniref:Cytochrome P450 monooxygenase n=1 Tax=Cercospora zeae-maydis SCOH1-5 TaxID=717836 RepID=A0A6A6FAJ0_9PEZI|nr:hypothetical protein CERZMDRAFT_99417 [Cercospora zeae-maydis SCOH1-5]